MNISLNVFTGKLITVNSRVWADWIGDFTVYFKAGAGESRELRENIHFTVGDFKENRGKHGKNASEVLGTTTHQKRLHGVIVEESTDINTDLRSWNPAIHAQVDGNVTIDAGIGEETFDPWKQQYGTSQMLCCQGGELFARGKDWGQDVWSLQRGLFRQVNDYTIYAGWTGVSTYRYAEQDPEKQYWGYNVYAFQKCIDGSWRRWYGWWIPAHGPCGIDEAVRYANENFDQRIKDGKYYTYLDEWDWNQGNPITVDSGGDIPDPGALMNYFRSFCNRSYIERLLKSLKHGADVEHAGPHALVAEAAATLSDPFEGNGIAYAKDAMEFKETSKQFLTQCKQLFKKGTKRVPFEKVRLIASLYLGVHYGWKLMWQDSKELSAALSAYSRNNEYEQLHSSGSFDWNYGSDLYQGVKTGFTIVYNRLEELRDAADVIVDKFDLMFNLGNAWDMIPFSFVVDWVSDIGDALDAIDKYTRISQKYKVYCGIFTLLAEHELSLPDGVSGTATYRLFSRDVEAGLPEPSYYVSSKVPGLKHLVEAGALTITMLP